MLLCLRIMDRIFIQKHQPIPTSIGIRIILDVVLNRSISNNKIPDHVIHPIEFFGFSLLFLLQEIRPPCPICLVVFSFSLLFQLLLLRFMLRLFFRWKISIHFLFYGHKNDHRYLFSRRILGFRAEFCNANLFFAPEF